MINELIIAGRLVEKPFQEIIDGKKVAYITLAIPRYYKNEEGVYDTDFIPITLKRQLAESVFTYCEKGDLISIKGSVGRLYGGDLHILANKVSYLKPSKKNKEEEIEIL